MWAANGNLNNFLSGFTFSDHRNFFAEDCWKMYKVWNTHADVLLNKSFVLPLPCHLLWFVWGPLWLQELCSVLIFSQTLISISESVMKLRCYLHLSLNMFLFNFKICPSSLSLSPIETATPVTATWVKNDIEWYRLMSRICFPIKGYFSLWSSHLFSWLSCLIQGWYCKEKLVASHS